MNERTDAHVVVTRKLTYRVTQETNARAGHLLDDIKAYKTETERTVMPENEENNAGSIIRAEVDVGMSSRHLQDVLTKAL